MSSILGVDRPFLAASLASPWADCEVSIVGCEPSLLIALRLLIYSGQGYFGLPGGGRETETSEMETLS